MIMGIRSFARDNARCEFIVALTGPSHVPAIGASMPLRADWLALTVINPRSLIGPQSNMLHALRGTPVSFHIDFKAALP